MLKLQKPPRLRPGDTVATVSPSSGMAGEQGFLWRYEQGKRRLEEDFGLHVVEMKNTLCGEEYLYAHPEKRAEDLMEAFADDSIRGIISCIGGSESIRLLPFMDFSVIHSHPKVFTGYSDITVPHFFCLKAGLSSFYGGSIFNDFAENVSMSPYTAESVRRTLFSGEPVGEIKPSATWSCQYLTWEEKNRDIAREFLPNTGYELLQGEGTVRGPLIGGCLEVISNIIGTSLFPDADVFDGAILFLETSEVRPPEWLFEDMLRHFGMLGILERVNGLFFGKPQAGFLYEEYKPIIRKVLAEFGCAKKAVLYNGSFGHNEPKALLPIGALAEIDCERRRFFVLEAGTL